MPGGLCQVGAHYMPGPRSDAPHVTHCEYRGNEVCGVCKLPMPVVWEHVIDKYVADGHIQTLFDIDSWAQ
ncbi:hypothetical protein CGRA01v4_06124 [Colletotrichum graminicola]|nr:hypothetical protein CGRA01v4_06124 [Colletotrichum graminicola]